MAVLKKGAKSTAFMGENSAALSELSRTMGPANGLPKWQTFEQRANYWFQSTWRMDMPLWSMCTFLITYCCNPKGNYTPTIDLMPQSWVTKENLETGNEERALTCSPSLESYFYLHTQPGQRFTHSRSFPADLRLQMEPNASISDDAPAVPGIALGYKLYTMTELDNKWKTLWQHFRELFLLLLLFFIGSSLGFHYFQHHRDAWKHLISLSWGQDAK